MEGPTIDSMCRCCASEGIFKDIKTSYQWMGEEEVYGDMLRECFDVKLASVEEGGICEVCITQLRNSVNFKKQVLQTEKKFKRQLDSGFFKRTEVKEEDDGNSSDDLDRGDDSEEDEDYVPDFEIPIKTESPEDSKSRKRGAKATTSRAKKSKSDPDYKSDDFQAIEIKLERLTDEEDVQPELEEILCHVDVIPQPLEQNQNLCPIPIRKKPVLVIRKPKKYDPDTQAPNTIQIKPAATPTPEQLELEQQRHNIRKILENSNATPIRKYEKGTGYHCCFCKSSFVMPADLKAHTIHEHDNNTKNKFMKNMFLITFYVKLDITELTCNNCGIALERVDELIAHLNSVHGLDLFADVKEYYACFKFNNHEMKCHICSVVFRNFKCLQEHMNKHSTNFICSDCGASYINLRQLNNHAVVHEKGTYKCATCEKVFKSNHNLQSHVRQTHTTVLVYKCYLCDERFRSRHKKRTHLIEVHGVVFAELDCDACHRTFKTLDSLTVHKRKVHLMERRFKCSTCDRAFFTTYLLKKHQLSHAKIKEFECTVCDKSYTRRYALVEHMRVHTKDRRYKCFFCESTFMQKQNMRDHMKNEHGTGFA